MPLNKSLFEKNIAGNAEATNGNSSGAPARRKWGNAASTATAGETNSNRPKWGGSHLKKANTTDANNNNTATSTPFGATLKKTPTKTKQQVPLPAENPVESVPEPTPPPPPPPEPTPVEPPVVPAENNNDTDTADLTANLNESVTLNESHKLQASLAEIELPASPTTSKIRTEEGPAHDWAAASSSHLTLDDHLHNNNTSKKDKKSKKKDKKSKEGSPFALDPGEYLLEVPPEKRTKGKFDWSGVQSVIDSIILDKKIEKKRDKLQQKLENINNTREDALKMMQEHVHEQKKKLDESKEKVRRKMFETCGGMTYNEMLEKVKENHDIVASLKKSNNKLRLDTQKMMEQIKNLRVNNMKLEAANEQSQKVLEQLKDRKQQVDARYEHLTKVIIPPYQERIKEMQDVVEERKLYGRNEHRTKIRYANYIIKFLDKVDRSNESDRFKTMIFEMGQHVEGGTLAPLEDDHSDDGGDDDDDVHLDAIPSLPSTMNESFQLGDKSVDDDNDDADDNDDNNQKSSNHNNPSSSNSSNNNKNAKNNASSTAPGNEEKSLWDRYGSGGGSGSKSTGLNASSDVSKKANQAKAKNFNGAVILSDSSSSSSSDSSDDVSLSSDDS